VDALGIGIGPVAEVVPASAPLAEPVVALDDDDDEEEEEEEEEEIDADEATSFVASTAFALSAAVVSAPSEEVWLSSSPELKPKFALELATVVGTILSAASFSAAEVALVPCRPPPLRGAANGSDPVDSWLGELSFANLAFVEPPFSAVVAPALADVLD